MEKNKQIYEERYCFECLILEDKSVKLQSSKTEIDDAPGIDLFYKENEFFINFSGNWEIQKNFPCTRDIKNAIDLFFEKNLQIKKKEVVFIAENLKIWDSVFLNILTKIIFFMKERDFECICEKLPRKILDLLFFIDKNCKSRIDLDYSLNLEKVNKKNPIKLLNQSEEENTQNWIIEHFEFIGKIFLAFFKLFSKKTKFHSEEFWACVQETGFNSFPIVALISFLVGSIMAFVGIVQLDQVGASIFVADLVGLAMVREMGAIMTAIIMAGRTGAAFTATLGTMKINEEIDALKIFGICPINHLVIPRMLSLSLMIPLLCVFSHFIGIIGGFAVSLSMLDFSFNEYFMQTKKAIDLSDFMIGIVKSFIFSFIISGVGCIRGLNCGSNATSIGFATTKSVVTSITWIIIADAICAVILNTLGI